LSDSGGEAKEPPAAHQIRIQSREDLVSVLSDASALEHMIMCQYLFAAFSLKRDESEGVDGEMLEKLRGWEKVIDTVAVQEMTHLALVNNMLVSVGSGPYFQHPNFPQPSRYFSPNIRLALVPFGEQALRHFLYLERPEGMSIEGVPGFEILGDLNPPELKGGILPQQEYFSTVGNLYRGIEKGFGDLVNRHGEDGVFIGANHPQATEEIFGLPSLFEVKDLSSARKAVEGIVEMGEGARGDWTNAHFGMFLRVFKEFMDAKKERGDFRPTRPVVAASVRPPLGQENATLITDPFTSKVADLFNASYGLAMHALSRFFSHQKEYPDELQALADTAVGLMEGTVEPLGVTLTSLPVGSRLPGVNAGPSFELQHREYVLPHRREAFMVIQERLLELSAYSVTLARESPSRKAGNQVKSVAASFSKLAEGLSVDSLNT
jgi:hypothetical protein